MASFPDKPLPLLSTNSSGKWEVNEEAVAVLKTVKTSISVTAIVGKYRTGKSFLMNKLAGKKSGFDLGGKIVAMTKGIWMLPVKHPKRPNCCMLLLDTEGLYDVQKGDPTNDLHLFTFALLLSNCMLFNTVGTIDSCMVNELHLVAELSEHIKIRKDADKDDDVVYFRTHFPSLCVVLRDCFLKMEVDDKQLTPDEYLEWSLKSKKGMSTKDQKYNAPRECLRQFFPKRRCFALPKPVSDDTKLLDLENVPDSDFSSVFLQRVDELVTAVYAEAKPIVLDGNRLTGAGFVSLMREYVRAINAGDVPCVESAVDVMTAEQCRKAKIAALSLYTKDMQAKLNTGMPVSTDELNNLHNELLQKALQTYSQLAVFQEKGCYAETLKELNQDIEMSFQALKGRNEKLSIEKSKEALVTCFSKLKQNMEERKFAAPGGHQTYVQHVEIATNQYRQCTRLGPMSDLVLHEYVQSLQTVEQSIIAADAKLSQKDKEEALLQKQIKEQQEQIELRKQEQKRQFEEQERFRQQQEEAIREMQREHQRNMEARMQEHSEASEQLRKEYENLLSKNQERQAEQFKMMVDQMEKDRDTKEKEAAQANERIAHMMDEMKRQQQESQQRDEAYRKEMAEMSERMAKANKEQMKELMERMEKRDAEHREDMRRMQQAQSGSNQPCVIL